MQREALRDATGLFSENFLLYDVSFGGKKDIIALVMSPHLNGGFGPLYDNNNLPKPFYQDARRHVVGHVEQVFQVEVVSTFELIHALFKD